MQVNSKKTNNNFFKYQIDFLNLEFDYEYEKINFDNLIEHPTIKNRYVLKSDIHRFNKNFSLFLKDKKAVMKFSIPYFLNGHNFCEINWQDLFTVQYFMKEKLGLDIRFAEVKELEFGAYEYVKDKGKNYIHDVIGLLDFELEKANTHFKMYGNKKRNLHYKIYDAVANSKSKKTFLLGNYPNEGLIKHEIKFTNAGAYFDSIFFIDLYDSHTTYLDELKNELISLRSSLVVRNQKRIDLKKTDLTNVLYTGLKTFEKGFIEDNVMKMLFEIIENSGLTPSQKSKRRKAISILESNYNQSS